MHSKRISRRNLLKALGVGGLAATPILQRTRAAAAAVPTDLAQLLSQIRQLLGRARWQHAIGDPRGIDIAVLLGRSREGRFGVMSVAGPAAGAQTQGARVRTPRGANRDAILK